ncbi:MAG: (2Fe-2S) ferredoxin domain-containing protein [Clostridiales bacterium]|nr:(2Fe-2S) ferredoxin domain-containing protein [Clostridiales bacterium]
MMILSVCVGSSCHLKGSYDVIETFKRLIAERDLADKIELRACFCLGRCSDGVAVKADGNYILGVNGANAEQKFDGEILPLLG